MQPRTKPTRMTSFSDLAIHKRRHEMDDDLSDALKASRVGFNNMSAAEEQRVNLTFRSLIDQIMSDKSATKHLSAKQRRRLSSKMHVIHDKENGVFHICRVEFVKKSKQYYPRILDKMYVSYTSSRRGLIYNHPLPIIDDDSTIFLIRSHFFDRYSQRAFNNELERVETLCTFVRRNLFRKRPLYFAATGELLVVLDNGVALGSGVRCHVDPHAPGDDRVMLLDSGLPKAKGDHDILLCSTFISDGMLSQSQRKRKAKLLRDAS